ncbi:unnamed protein product [Cylicostephanus goldi]|uniref:Uncharacterized protein n=1 Tax=Cylicostephanus goldi TaxID=71465 RepID=A0A3P6QN74_CYLGO|nr:unnamed protein product [Cylicostephanus goldi]
MRDSYSSLKSLRDGPYKRPYRQRLSAPYFRYRSDDTQHSHRFTAIHGDLIATHWKEDTTLYPIQIFCLEGGKA